MNAIRNIFVVAILLTPMLMRAADGRPTVEQLIASHLNSIGSAELRNAARLQKLEGKVEFSEVVGGQVHLTGTASFISQQEKLKCAFQFGVAQYIGEQFVFDGKKTQVAMTDPSNRSLLGQFLFTQPEILRDGLFGGTLSTAWPLLDVAGKGPKLKYNGLKKLDGREVHELTYAPKKLSGSGDLTIRLYFDPATFQHVMTSYKLVVHNASGSIQNGDDEITEFLEEQFSEFQETGGVTLPTRWQIQYKKTPGKPRVLQWEVQFELTTNQK